MCFHLANMNQEQLEKHYKRIVNMSQEGFSVDTEITSISDMVKQMEVFQTKRLNMEKQYVIQGEFTRFLDDYSIYLARNANGKHVQVKPDEKGYTDNNGIKYDIVFLLSIMSNIQKSHKYSYQKVTEKYRLICFIIDGSSKMPLKLTGYELKFKRILSNTWLHQYV